MSVLTLTLTHLQVESMHGSSTHPDTCPSSCPLSSTQSTTQDIHQGNTKWPPSASSQATQNGRYQHPLLHLWCVEHMIWRCIPKHLKNIFVGGGTEKSFSLLYTVTAPSPASLSSRLTSLSAYCGNLKELDQPGPIISPL